LRIIVGISGASGAVYGWELLKFLRETDHTVDCVVSANGWRILEHECGIGPNDIRNIVDCLHEVGNVGASIASGSFKTDAMIIAPCSMKTLAAIAHGFSDNLLIRAADVMIKERRKLVLVPRETPLSSIHLRNMLSLSDTGVTILPACPGYYHLPTTLSDIVKIMVGKMADAIGIENQLYKRWIGEMESSSGCRQCIKQ